MSLRKAAIATAAVCAAVPASALADIPVRVPAGLLGGTVPSGLRPAATPPATPAGATALADDGTGIDPADPNFWELVWPLDVAPLPFPDETDAAQCPATTDECVLAGDAAAAPDVANENATGARPLPATLAAALHVSPAFGTWLSGRPTLTWRPTGGASIYNVQVLLGGSRVVNAWTRGNTIRLPKGAIDQGRYYMWAVWPGFGSRRAPRYGTPIGRSIFGVILRPRIVFSTVGGTGGRVVTGEVRPHIPGGLLALKAPASLRGRVPGRVRIDAQSRVVLRIAKADASRLTARLIDSGPTPPKGLRRR